MKSCERTLIIVFIVLKIGNAQNCENNNNDDFFIAQNLMSGNQKCITNSSSALTWNIPMYHYTDMASKYIPTIESSFDCNLDHDNCTKNYWTKETWRVVHMSVGKIKEPILDRRWENFGYYYCEHATPFYVWNVPNSSFEIFWSIRAKCGTRFHLCPTKNPTEMCHKIMIQSCKYNFTTIKNGDAKSSETEKKGKRRFLPYLLDENEWKHFKFMKSDHKMSLFSIEKDVESLIQEFEDPKNLLNNSYAYISSKHQSLWKFHHYNYLFTDHAATVTLGPTFTARNQTVCISMFVALCQNCSIRLSIINSAWNSLSYFEEEYTAKQPFSWEEIRFITTYDQNFNLNLNVTTIFNGNGEGFWAIDAVRECQKEEYRSLELPRSQYYTNTSCQLLSYKGKTLKFSTGEKMENQSNCTENRIGKFCVPCNWISELDCSKLKIFEKNETFCNPNCNNNSNCNNSQPTTIDNKVSENVQNKSQYFIIPVILIVVFILLLLATTYIYRNHKNIWTNGGDERVHFNELNSGTTSTLGVHYVDFTPRDQEIRCNPVKIVDFKQYVQKLVDQSFGQQLEEIKTKEQILGSTTIEFSNHFYMEGYKVQKGFIILAGNQASSENFWQMIWRENVNTAVFLADNTTETAENYWPTTKKKRFGNFTVLLNSEETLERYRQRTYEVHLKNNKRKVLQIYCVLGPDHTPALSQNLPALLKNILKISLDQKSPILLHCSSLLEKAETVVLCDAALRMAANEGLVDIPKLYQNLKFPQPINRDFFKVSHFAILDCFLNFEETLTRDELLRGIGNFIKLQTRYLINLIRNEGVDVANNLYESYYSTISDNNAFTVGATTFICMKEPENRNNFWKFVTETDIKAIVSLNQTHLHVFQDGKCTVTTASGETQCRHVQTKESKSYKSITIELKNKQNRRRIEIICCNEWQDGESLPKNVTNFVKFFEVTFSTKSNSTIVVCQDGVTATGVYLALVFLVEKIKVEGICDVPNAIRAVRKENNECFRQEDQIAFLYSVIQEYTARETNCVVEKL